LTEEGEGGYLGGVKMIFERGDGCVIPLSIFEGKSKEISVKPMTIKISKRRLKKIRKEMCKHMKGDLNGHKRKHKTA